MFSLLFFFALCNDKLQSKLFHATWLQNLPQSKKNVNYNTYQNFGGTFSFEKFFLASSLSAETSLILN